jgi:hypothetical protein
VESPLADRWLGAQRLRPSGDKLAAASVATVRSGSVAALLADAGGRARALSSTVGCLMVAWPSLRMSTTRLARSYPSGAWQSYREDADAARFAWVVRCLSSWGGCHGWQWVCVKGEGVVRSRVQTVTPKKAAEYLARNTANRPLAKRTVREFAQAMRRGEWLVTHQGIAFDTTGALVDGQHRLAAIIEADI